jgi:hypothetical protein
MHIGIYICTPLDFRKMCTTRFWLLFYTVMSSNHNYYYCVVLCGVVVVASNYFILSVIVMHKKKISPHRDVIDIVMLLSENGYLHSKTTSSHNQECEITKVR